MAFNQKYNYHTHTYRSGHSRYVSDETVLEAAKSIGIEMLGFTEHIPNPELVLPEEDWKMLLSEVDEYIESINGLKERHLDMTILTGMEAEYDPMREAFMGEMRNKVDYMILGQHYVRKGLNQEEFNSPDYPIKYAKTVVDGINSGLFDIVAHPDIFMKHRDQVAPEYRAQFEANAKIASRMICEKARDMGIPIEINLSPSILDRKLSDGYLEYPHPLFWQIAATIDGLQVVKGVDAHSPNSFYVANEENQQIKAIEDLVKDKLILDSYNPVLARDNNQELKDALANRQANALTFATHLITRIIQDNLGETGNNLSSNDLATAINQILDGLKTKCLSNAKNKLHAISLEADEIKLSPKSLEEKDGKLKRKEKAFKDIDQILLNQNELIEKAKEAVNEALARGCETQPEFICAISEAIQKETTIQKTKEDVKQKRLTRNPNQSQGFISTSLISIVVLVVVLILIIFSYLLLQ